MNLTDTCESSEKLGLIRNARVRRGATDKVVGNVDLLIEFTKVDRFQDPK